MVASSWDRCRDPRIRPLWTYGDYRSGGGPDGRVGVPRSVGSASGLLVHIGTRVESPDVCPGGDGGAKSGDLFVLGGQSRQGLGLELGQLGDGAVVAGDAGGEARDRFLERGPLCGGGGGGLPRVAQGAQAVLAFLA